ncbi:hypothetical protein ACO0K7_07140 [Undibacterium sp. Ji67W]|uniref:hypothetical protein n=1 Tax=Undibacterium sp. Ji67W TaxID=3413042 RepID=UPI003BF01956
MKKKLKYFLLLLFLVGGTAFAELVDNSDIYWNEASPQERAFALKYLENVAEKIPDFLSGSIYKIIENIQTSPDILPLIAPVGFGQPNPVDPTTPFIKKLLLVTPVVIAIVHPKLLELRDAVAKGFFELDIRAAFDAVIDVFKSTKVVPQVAVATATQQEQFTRLEKIYRRIKDVEEVEEPDAPTVYTWARGEPPQPVASGGVFDWDQDQSAVLAYFLSDAAYERKIRIGNGRYLNVYPPKYDENKREIMPGRVAAERSYNKDATGGFFWSSSSNAIYLGKYKCLAVDNSQNILTAVSTTCKSDEPKQMWRRLPIKLDNNEVPIKVAYESVAFPGKCFSNLQENSFFIDRCFIWDYRGVDASGLFNEVTRDATLSYEEDSKIRPQPTDTTVFIHNKETFDYDVLVTSFDCIENVAIGFHQSNNLENACSVKHRVPRAVSGVTWSVIFDDVCLIDSDNPDVCGKKVKRRHVVGSDILAPLLPGQWRVYVINIGQGLATIVDGYGWNHPIVYDTGSFRRITTRRPNFEKHATELVKFMSWILKDGKSVMHASAPQDTPQFTSTARRPILMISHADFDHYNLLEYVFNRNHPQFGQLPAPYSVYIGGDLSKFSTAAEGVQKQTRLWLENLAAPGSDTRFYEKIKFVDNKLYASKNKGGESQISAAFPLIGDDSNVTLETVSNSDRKDRPWLYFLESQWQLPDANFNSLVVSVADRTYSVTLPGDAVGVNEDDAGKRVKNFGIHARKGLMLAPHHGSEKGSNQVSFYKAFKPTSVIFSAGDDPTFKHPRLKSYENATSADSLLCLANDGGGRRTAGSCAATQPGFGYVGGNSIDFKKGGTAIFATEHHSPDRDGEVLAGDIIVTVTPLGGMVSNRYFSTPMPTTLLYGVPVAFPTIEYFFSGHRIGGKGEPLRSDVSLLINTDPNMTFQAGYCANEYLHSRLENGTKIADFGELVDYSKPYPTFLWSGFMKSFKYNIPPLDQLQNLTLPRGTVLTQIPVESSGISCRFRADEL